GYTTKQRGSGYGLHSAAHFVRSLGGEIEAESQGRHQGLVMRVKLPIEMEQKDGGSSG
ncbi:MAG: histidine kinase, partial [Gammaproteobacteria bacterium]|nr:histidine kinase [Gammaproteobacteria bacterium]